ncbi:hypothetical protein ACHQM5_009365 [Ranunculus cassubicifolius]
MAWAMEKPSTVSQQQEEADNFSLREWALKANNISRDTTKSRRHSASHIRSFRDEAKSIRSTANISSTVSSPGYNSFRNIEEINPSTYSFTSALKALQVKSGYGWEWLSSPDGVALNSKWNEAEKYICNPLSGEFPMECLSAKTLSGRSFAALKPRTTMSGPLLYSSRQTFTRTKSGFMEEEDEEVQSPLQDKKEVLKRDVGTQSTPPDDSSSSPSPASTPIRDKCESFKTCSISKFKVQIEMINDVAELKKEEQRNAKVLTKYKQGKCLPWNTLGRGKKQKGNQKSSWKFWFWKRNIKTNK